MSDKLLAFQAALKAYLDAQPYFSGVGQANTVVIPTVTDDVSDVSSEVDRALASAAGICALIRMPEGDIKSADTPTPVYDPATGHIRIYEDATTNRGLLGTGEPAGAVANAVIQLLWCFGGAGGPAGWNPIVPKRRKFGQELDPTTGVVTPFYDVFFETVIALDGGVPTRQGD